MTVGLYITSRVVNERDIGIWWRTESGKKYKVYQYRPFFYVPSKLGVYRSVFGEPLDRVYVNTPIDVRTAREKYERHYEADIPYVRRYLIDKDIQECHDIDTLEAKPCTIKPVVAYIDIEVDNENGELPSEENPIYKIVAVTVHIQGNYHAYYLNDVAKERTGYYKLTANDKEYVLYLHARSFTNEKDLIQEVYNLIKDVDIVTAWNVSFDMRYLYARAKHLNVKFTYNGWLELDLLSGYKEFVRARSYKLKEVTVAEGLEKKEEAVEFVKVNKNPNEIIRYNIRDVWRIVMIDKKYSIVDYYQALKNVVGVEDFSFQYYTSIVIDTLLLRLAKREGVVLPTSVDRDENPVRGAIVLNPPSGRYENVAVLDMSRYYPSIIISFNVSPETKLKRITDEIWSFRQDKMGLMPKLAMILLKRREELEDEMKKYPGDSEEYKTLEKKVMALKYIINSAYGYMGHPQARFYDRDCASTITALAREGIQYVIEQSKRYGHKTLYGDTDSVFIQVPFEKAEELSKQLTNDLRRYFMEKYSLKSEPTLSLKFEKYLGAVYFTGVKKRYAAKVVWKKGKQVNEIDIKGFEAIRTDSSKITQELEEKVFELLLDGRPMTEVIQVKNDFIRKIKELPLEDVALYRGITRRIDEYKTLPPHVRAAVLANKYFNKNYGYGSRIRYVWCKGYENGISADVCVVDDGLPKPIVDWKRQIEAVIEGPFKNLGITNDITLELWE